MDGDQNLKQKTKTVFNLQTATKRAQVNFVTQFSIQFKIKQTISSDFLRMTKKRTPCFIRFKMQQLFSSYSKNTQGQHELLRARSKKICIIDISKSKNLQLTKLCTQKTAKTRRKIRFFRPTNWKKKTAIIFFSITALVRLDSAVRRCFFSSRTIPNHNSVR